MQTNSAPAAEVALLLELNRAYIEAVTRSDAKWFDRMVTSDFRCSLPDGTLIDRERFLERAAGPLEIADLKVHDVVVRVFGEAAIVHARTTFVMADGRPGSGRYTDTWCRQNGEWLVAAAHFTRRTD